MRVISRLTSSTQNFPLPLYRSFPRGVAEGPSLGFVTRSQHTPGRKARERDRPKGGPVKRDKCFSFVCRDFALNQSASVYWLSAAAVRRGWRWVVNLEVDYSNEMTSENHYKWLSVLMTKEARKGREELTYAQLSVSAGK